MHTQPSVYETVALLFELHRHLELPMRFALMTFRLPSECSANRAQVASGAVDWNRTSNSPAYKAGALPLSDNGLAGVEGIAPTLTVLETVRSLFAFTPNSLIV